MINHTNFIYDSLSNFMNESVPTFFGMVQYKENYLNVIHTLYYHRNLFLWIMVLITYFFAFFTEDIYLKNSSQQNKRIKQIEDENKKLKSIIENLVQRQENYEEYTRNVFLNELVEFKNHYNRENDKIVASFNKLIEDINQKDEGLEKLIQGLKNSISIQKTRITKLKNQLEDRVNELSEQYETLSMNDSASMVENED